MTKIRDDSTSNTKLVQNLHRTHIDLRNVPRTYIKINDLKILFYLQLRETNIIDPKEVDKKTRIRVLFTVLYHERDSESCPNK